MFKQEPGAAGLHCARGFWNAQSIGRGGRDQIKATPPRRARLPGYFREGNIKV